ncbi:MAG: hypothetical protein JJ896_04625 [Rhodothermales bacterium]|nr:hypothetical protein [Rhodothermales bacterium]MBO6778917.1 hypothetical protein [Rhodothermales bacterium]
MKRRTVPVEIWFDGNQPVILQREGWAEPVHEVIERWDVRGRWWSQDTQRHYMTVRTQRGTFEVCGDRRTQKWAITGTFD